MKPAILTLIFLLTSCATKSANPKVRLGNSGTGLQTWSMPMTLASTLGFFEAEGVDAVIENLPNTVKVMQALLGGSIDVVGLPFVQNIQMAADGQSVRSFFLMTRQASMVLLVAPSANQRIQRIQDLKGAVIGVPALGSQSHLWTNSILAAHGIGPSEFTAVGIGAAASSIAAIESGRVDAAQVAGGDHIRLLRRHPNLRILLDGSKGQSASSTAEIFASGALSAKQEWLDRNPDTARRLARAMLRTHQWIATHSVEQIHEKLPPGFHSEDAALDREIIQWGLDTYTIDGRMPLGAPESMKRFLDSAIEKVRTTKIDLNATWTNDFLPAAK